MTHIGGRVLAFAFLVMFVSACGDSPVDPASAIVSMSISSESEYVEVEESLVLEAVALDARGNRVEAAHVHWVSHDRTVARVNTEGIVTGRAPGAVTIEAQTTTHSAHFLVTVVPGPPNDVHLTTATADVEVGGTITVAVAVTDRHGHSVRSPEVSWNSTLPEVARVSEGGVVEGVSPGVTEIRAVAGEVAGSIEIRVLRQPTLLGGILLRDRVLLTEESPYELDSTLEVAEGVTLTIQPGVVLRRGNSTAIHLWGTLKAEGTPDRPILLDGIDLRPRDHWEAIGTARTILRSVEMSGGSFGASFVYSMGHIEIEEATLAGVSIIKMTRPSSTSRLERNVFMRPPISVDLGVPGASIRNNVFADWHDSPNSAASTAVESTGVEVIVEQNSFLISDGYALRLVRSGEINGRNNYWGTTDTDRIQSMIFDRHRSLEITHTIPWEPFLSEPHPLTPEVRR